MSLDQDIELLSRVSMFRDFSVEQLRLIAFGSERQRLAAGQVLFADGEPSDGGYVVARGQVDLVIDHKGRRELVDAHVEGALLGELALISPTRRMGTAVTRKGAEVMFIPRELFHRMLGEYPEMAVLLAERIADSVNRMMHSIDQVGQRLSSITPMRRAGVLDWNGEDG